MAEKSVPTQKRLVLLSGRSHPELAESVADELGIALSPTLAYDFANGEIFIRFRESVRGTDAFVLQSHTTPINTWIMEQLIMIDALKRASAKRITVIVPFYGYARQDKKHRGREPISARLMADLFKAAGADRAEHVASRVATDQITVVSPDAGRVRVAERWTDVLGAPLAIIHKRRDPDVPNQVRVFEVVGDVRDRVCVVVDDMIDTGGTIVKAAETLFENGAKDVIVAATHGILSDPARDRLQQSQISEVVVTDTLPIPPERQFDKLTVLSIAPILATAINEVFTDGSVTSMFEAATADEASSH